MGVFPGRAAVRSWPLSFSDAERWANFHPELINNLTEKLLRAQLHRSNAVHKAMASGQFDFGAYDADEDGSVTQDELQIMILDNDGQGGNTVRDAGCVQPPGSPYSWCGRVAWFSQATDFATVCHELSHLLGTVDLYGAWNDGNSQCLSLRLTLLSCTGGINRKYHMDPWHKMQLGWSEPRIRSLRTGGIESLPAAQMRDPSAPVILFDPEGGTTEFFMLEYRTRSSPAGADYDADVRGDGLVVWRVRQTANHSPETVPSMVGEGEDRAVWNEGPPDFPRGAGGCWGSDTMTPRLQWLDGTQTTRTRLQVRPFSEGDASIRVEWLTEGEIWVDFAYNGSELGSFSNPFDTLAEGLIAIPYGGTLNIKAGSTPEAVTIRKRISIQA